MSSPRELERRGDHGSAMDAGAMIDAWRERGDHRLDPVRFRFIEALARRAAAHRGEARRILDDKLAKLLAAYGEDLEKAPLRGRRRERRRANPARGALCGSRRTPCRPACDCTEAAGLPSSPRS